MTNLHEAAQQALAALQAYANSNQVRRQHPAKHRRGLLAINALREALPEPAYKPVAWVEAPYGAIRANPLYRLQFPQSLALSIPLYTAPPRRKPLDDLAIADIYTKWDATPGTSMADFARAIERAHGIGEAND